MTSVDLAVSRLQTDEGFRSTAYRDTAGHLTIGYGFNVDAGISQYAALALLDAQTQEIATQLAQYPWYQGLDDVRASVMIELAFNLGLHGLLGFVHMLAALDLKDWQTAHDQLLDSDAARELPTRYNALALLLLNGG
jgi:lysozyme